MTLKMDKRKIVATLSYGKVPSRFMVGVFTTMLIGCIILLPIIVSTLIAEKQYQFLIISIFAIVLGLFLSGYFLFHCYKINNKIKLWKQDAVLLKAKSKIVAEQRVPSYGVTEDKVAKISVTFKYEGKRIKIVSEEQGEKDFFHSKVGFDKLFKEYDDREIDILYSPRFHQVMILE